MSTTYPHELQVLGHSSTSLLRQVASAFVTDPAVDATAPRVNPEQVLEAKVLW